MYPPEEDNNESSGHYLPNEEKGEHAEIIELESLKETRSAVL